MLVKVMPMCLENFMYFIYFRNTAIYLALFCDCTVSRICTVHNKKI